MRAHRPQGERQRRGCRGGLGRGGGSPAHHLRQRPQGRHAGVGGPVQGAARSDDQGARQRVQADAQRRGVLARLGEEPAAPAHLRHGLADQGRPHGLPGPAGRGREAGPPQARRRARPVLLPGRAGIGAARVPPQGWGDQEGDGGLREAAAHRGGLRVRRHPAHHQGGSVPHLGAPAVLRGHDVPADGARGEQLLPQGHELPDAQPGLPQPWPLLPRAAPAVLRVRVGLPVREVRRHPRPDPGPRAGDGRLPLLRDAGAGTGRDHPPAGLRPVAAAGLRARRLLPRALDPRRRGGEEGQVHR